MVAKRRIEYLKFRFVSPGDTGKEGKTYQCLKDMLNRVAEYFELLPINGWDLSHRMNCHSAINALSEHLGIYPLRIKSHFKRLDLGVPLIAREKVHDELVLLLPVSKSSYKIWKNQEVSSSLQHHEVLTHFDEFVQLFPVLPLSQKHKGYQFPEAVTCLLPKGGLASSAFFLVAFLLVFLYFSSIYLQIDFQQPFVITMFGLITSGFLIMIKFYAHALSLKNYALIDAGLLYGFYDRIFRHANERLIKIRIEKIARIADGIFILCKNSHLSLFLFYAAGLYVIIFLVIACPFGIWGIFTVILFYGLALIMCVSLRRWFLKIYGETESREDELSLDLEHVGQSLNSTIGLKAYAPLIDRLLYALDGVLGSAIDRSLLKLLSAALFFLFPSIALVCFSWWYSITDISFSPWQMALALTLVMLDGAALACLTHPSRHLALALKRPVERAVMLEKQLKTRVEPVDISGAIELINVSFCYEDSASLVIKNCHLRLKAGHFYIIYGPSGAGKTTLLRLLMGDLDPNLGQIIFDGQDAQSLALESLKKHFGVISDERSLFAGTIHDNIVCGRDTPKKRLEQLFLSHEIFDRLLDLPLGLETYVTTFGKNLSRRECFEILLLRALLHDPKILFIDEGLSGFGKEEQKLLLKYLSELKMTKIVTSNVTPLADCSENFTITGPLKLIDAGSL